MVDRVDRRNLSKAGPFNSQDCSTISGSHFRVLLTSSRAGKLMSVVAADVAWDAAYPL